MSKPFDACILGATGFTGKYVLQAWLSATRMDGDENSKIAIAGRSRSRLEAVLEWAGVNESLVAIIIADVYDEESVKSLCQQTKTVLNCVGPFRYWGEPVVKACVENGVDYLDICGEPEFMERMELLYHDKAKQSGSLIVSSCGFDCIPAEIGVIHASRQFPPPGAPNSVESFISFTALHGLKVNYGTWESLVQGIASAPSLRKLRSARPKPLPLPTPGPIPKRNNSPYFDERVQAFAVPFPGADASVVKRTMQSLTKDISVGKKTEAVPVHFAAYFTVKSRWHLLLTGFYAGLATHIAKFSWGRKLLLKFPGFFSHGIFTKEGPSKEQIEGTSTTVLLISKGYKDLGALTSDKSTPDREVITRIHTPEPAYAATSIFIVCCALSLMEFREKLPEGGVFTPGYVLAGTDLESRLRKNGIGISVVNESSL